MTGVNGVAQNSKNVVGDLLKFLWLDNWYDAAWKEWQRTGGPMLHGTADFWDIALRAAGHESDTYIANAGLDKKSWVQERNPDVLIVQNIGKWPARNLDWFHGKKVAFCSYAATAADMAGWDAVFTSFPWLTSHLSDLGQKSVYLPLAFGAAVLDLVEAPAGRDLPITFVGGLGHRIWSQGTNTMAAVAEAFPDDFHWYGYKVGPIPAPLERCYRGEAWGADYWQVLMRSQITLNRHGEIAKGYANNMRIFEATACGAVLFTEEAPNLSGFFEPGTHCSTYRDTDDLIASLRGQMKDGVDGLMGRDAQTHCLADHTYEHRVPAFLEAIESC